MQITYLGHAGFLLETEKALVVTDPWLSPEGAFDSAWFQFPCNHHIGPWLREKLESSSKSLFVYVSHEHRDHFDPEFLKTLPLAKINFLVPRFQRPALREHLGKLRPNSLISCTHGQIVAIPGGTVRLFLDDSGLNRDSAILVKADGHSFLDLNDCKLYDQVASIRAEECPISVLTCQFSGATWHPTCYDYEPHEYERISRLKLLGKFEMVARAIEAVQPSAYLPSAGPACFLDPELLHLNFEPVNIFPRTPQFISFLRRRLSIPELLTPEMMPGDVLDSTNWELHPVGRERVSEQSFRCYIETYAAQYRHLFVDRQVPCGQLLRDSLMIQLQENLQRKVDALTMADQIRVPLYFGFLDITGELLRIDFPDRKIERVFAIREPDFYSIKAPSWQIARILDGAMTWEEFALTFRMRLNRKPDVYQTLIQGFLLMEPEDMNWFCERLLSIERRGKRITVEAGGNRYSIDRFCPHQGADLSQGWLAERGLWTCPRHRWQFDLDKGGQCLTSNGSIHSVCLEND